jgi:hypothetical protein
MNAFYCNLSTYTNCTIPVRTTVFLKMNPPGSKHVEDIKN